jgi:hypothetical protein
VWWGVVMLDRYNESPGQIHQLPNMSKQKLYAGTR